MIKEEQCITYGNSDFTADEQDTICYTTKLYLLFYEESTKTLRIEDKDNQVIISKQVKSRPMLVNLHEENEKNINHIIVSIGKLGDVIYLIFINEEVLLIQNQLQCNALEYTATFNDDKSDIINIIYCTNNKLEKEDFNIKLKAYEKVCYFESEEEMNIKMFKESQKYSYVMSSDDELYRITNDKITQLVMPVQYKAEKIIGVFINDEHLNVILGNSHILSDDENDLFTCNQDANCDDSEDVEEKSNASSDNALSQTSLTTKLWMETLNLEYEQQLAEEEEKSNTKENNQLCKMLILNQTFESRLISEKYGDYLIVELVENSESIYIISLISGEMIDCVVMQELFELIIFEEKILLKLLNKGNIYCLILNNGIYQQTINKYNEKQLIQINTNYFSEFDEHFYPLYYLFKRYNCKALSEDLSKKLIEIEFSLLPIIIFTNELNEEKNSKNYINVEFDELFSVLYNIIVILYKDAENINCSELKLEQCENIKESESNTGENDEYHNIKKCHNDDEMYSMILIYISIKFLFPLLIFKFPELIVELLQKIENNRVNNALGNILTNTLNDIQENFELFINNIQKSSKYLEIKQIYYLLMFCEELYYNYVNNNMILTNNLTDNERTEEYKNIEVELEEYILINHEIIEFLEEEQLNNSLLHLYEEDNMEKLQEKSYIEELIEFTNHTMGSYEFDENIVITEEEISQHILLLAQKQSNYEEIMEEEYENELDYYDINIDRIVSLMFETIFNVHMCENTIEMNIFESLLGKENIKYLESEYPEIKEYCSYKNSNNVISTKLIYNIHEEVEYIELQTNIKDTFLELFIQYCLVDDKIPLEQEFRNILQEYQEAWNYFTMENISQIRDEMEEYLQLMLQMRPFLCNEILEKEEISKNKIELETKSQEKSEIQQMYSLQNENSDSKSSLRSNEVEFQFNSCISKNQTELIEDSVSVERSSQIKRPFFMKNISKELEEDEECIELETEYKTIESEYQIEIKEFSVNHLYVLENLAMNNDIGKEFSEILTIEENNVKLHEQSYDLFKEHIKEIVLSYLCIQQVNNNYIEEIVINSCNYIYLKLYKCCKNENEKQLSLYFIFLIMFNAMNVVNYFDIDTINENLTDDKEKNLNTIVYRILELAVTFEWLFS